MPANTVPDESELKRYFEANSEKYKVPEIRDVAVLVVDCQKFLGELKIDDAEVEQLYEENKGAYTQEAPETRDFERFVFEAQEDAEKAWDMLNKGAPSAEIARKFAIKVGTICNVHATDFSEHLGDELFRLKLNKLSEISPIAGKYYIYRSLKIHASKQLNAVEIKEKIKEDLRREKMNSAEFYEKIKDIKNKIDDGFGAGKSIDDVAKEVDMTVVEFRGLKSDKEASEKLAGLIKDKETRDEVFEVAFSTEEQQASQSIDPKETDSVSYVVYVRHVEKPNLPPYEKIADKVKADFIFEQQDNAGEEKARSIVNNGPTATAETAKMQGAKRFKVSKRDLLQGTAEASKDGGIIKEVPNHNDIL
jgi:hypothetical protein